MGAFEAFEGARPVNARTPSRLPNRRAGTAAIRDE
jgi:hypothetical protein